MGWRSWNAYQTDITQGLMVEALRVLAQPQRLSAALGGASSSLAALGFATVGIDEGWAKCHAGVNGSFHGADGRPIVDTAKFPDLRSARPGTDTRRGQLAWVRARGISDIVVCGCVGVGVSVCACVRALKILPATRAAHGPRLHRHGAPHGAEGRLVLRV